MANLDFLYYFVWNFCVSVLGFYLYFLRGGRAPLLLDFCNFWFKKSSHGFTEH